MIYYYTDALWQISKQENLYLYFITTAPAQYEKSICKCKGVFYITQKHPDSYYLDKIKIVYRNKKYLYICCAERQRNTQNIHFHLLLASRERLFTDSNSKFLHCRKQVTKFAKLFDQSESNSLYDVKEITNYKGIVSYCSKLYPNHNKKTTSPFSSLYECRTFTCSTYISKYFKLHATQWVRKIRDETLYKYKDKLKLIKSSKYFNAYEYNKKIFEESIH